jgi:hypothetical protein
VFGEGMGLKRRCELGKRCVPRDGIDGVKENIFHGKKMCP